MKQEEERILCGTSLVAQWLRVCLPLKGTQARSLVRQLKIPHATGQLSPHAAMKTHACSVAQLCPALHDSMDCSPPGSSVHGILQPRILEWVAMPSARYLFKYLFNTAKYLNKQTKNFFLLQQQWQQHSTSKRLPGWWPLPRSRASGFGAQLCNVGLAVVLRACVRSLFSMPVP